MLTILSVLGLIAGGVYIGLPDELILIATFIIIPVTIGLGESTEEKPKKSWYDESGKETDERFGIDRDGPSTDDMWNG